MWARAGTAALLLAGLMACGEPPGTGGAPPAPATAGPVNPDAGVTTYVCVDGQTVTAGYPDRQTAVVTYKDHAYTLKRAPSTAGDRYTGYGLQWSVKGAQAEIAALAQGEESAGAAGVACAAAPAEPAATRT